MIETGTLPCDEPDHTLGGRGLGRACSACAEEILWTELEFKVDLPSGLRLHRRS
jgi:hypothetical protein